MADRLKEIKAYRRVGWLGQSTDAPNRDMDWLIEEVERLRAGIRTHRAQTDLSPGIPPDDADVELWSMVP